MSASPEARWAARRFIGTCLEIVNGYRPAAQIRPLTSPVDTTEIVEQLASATARLVPPRRPPNRPPDVVRLRRLHVCEPRPGVAEVTAVLSGGGRTWAMPFRLERGRRVGGAWVGTTIRLL